MSRVNPTTKKGVRAKPKHDQAKLEHDALVTLCAALGQLPANTLDQASFKAYSAATNVLDPDEFTARFMASATKP